MPGKEQNGIEEEEPWKNAELMRRLYLEEGRSANDIKDLLGCAIATVLKWLDEHGIERRSRSEAISLAHGTADYVPMTHHTDGHEQFHVRKKAISVHRLLAVAEWGADAVAGMHVHHKNGIPWDNRIENLELLTPSEHHSKHKKVTGDDRKMIADTYESTDLSSRDVGGLFDVSNGTVLQIHKEYYGDSHE